jgi:hypothetical protein
MNLLLIGSCRLIPLAYYFQGLCRTVYRLDISKAWPDMTSVLEHTDLIVCEPSHRVDLFLESTDITVYVVPNLELRMYIHDLIHVFHVELDYTSLYRAFQDSRRHLSQELQDYGYEALDDFIDQNLQTMKLFSSYNHPMPVLTVLLFQRLAEQMNLEIPEAWLDQCRTVSCLQGNDTPLFDLDRDLYQLVFLQEKSNSIL